MRGLSEIWPDIELWARRNGVLRVGASPLRDAHLETFREWLARGLHGSMTYLERHAAVRERPEERYPWARSAIAITVPYSPERPQDDSIAAHIARYAQGDDYHLVLDRLLVSLEELLNAGDEVRTWRYVDTGPLSDRALAAQAGLGWVGKNGMLIDEEHGSWFFIGVLLTSLECDVDPAAVSDRCGRCTRCIDACPTDAILPGRIVDSHRCISHATIEQRGTLDPAMLESLGSNAFGCDICQEVCPWNRRPAEGHPDLAPREAYRARPITDLLRMTQDEFSTTFRRSAVKRAKRAGLLRNSIAVVQQVSDDDLDQLSTSDDAGVSAAAGWRRRRG